MIRRVPVCLLLVLAACEPGGNGGSAPAGRSAGVGVPPPTAEERHRRAEELLKESRYAEASAEYRRLLEADEKDVAALLGLATIALNMGDGASALEFAARASREKPDKPEVLNLLGVALVSAGRRTDAAKVFDHALSIRPDDPRVLLNASLCFADLGQWKRADDCARRAGELMPKVTTPHALRGRFKVRQGLHAEAVPHFRKAAELAPDHGTAHYRLGKALVKSGHREEGVRSLRAALRTNPPTEIRREIEALLAEK